MKEQLKNLFAGSADLLLAPLTLVSALLLRTIRRMGLARTPVSRWLFSRLGVLPIRHHYYEPMFTVADTVEPLDRARELPGIDWNLTRQLELLKRMDYAGEIANFTAPKSSPFDFRLGNGSYESGDAEYLYQLLRVFKPRRFVEVGCGQSTLIAQRALRRNAEETGQPVAHHVCIEPFEQPWLESAGVSHVLRQRVERVDRSFFAELRENDVFFIDSSHVIRPQGDVLYEYLQLLPSLASGVIVHVHDIFSPYDYPREWLLDSMLLWNEQYLLEAFLTQNRHWEILGAVYYLAQTQFPQLKRVCPFLTPERTPGSFYLRRV